MRDIKARNGMVFAIRDEAESSRGGIDISEGAIVKSMDATIAFCDDNCGFAESGDRIHLPHFGVDDIEIDGVEYATFRDSRLFFANGSPINKYVLVRKCEEDHVRDESGEIALYMTDKHIETTNWCEVLECADDCQSMSNEYQGLFTPLVESDERLARLGNSKDFCVHEDLIKFVTEG